MPDLGREIVHQTDGALGGWMDPSAMGQLVSNLVSLVHGDYDQPLAVDAEAQGESFFARVTNQGAEISESAHESIFNPFVRAKRETGLASGSTSLLDHRLPRRLTVIAVSGPSAGARRFSGRLALARAGPTSTPSSLANRRWVASERDWATRSRASDRVLPRFGSLRARRSVAS
jgi:hypothetical protein